MVAVFYEGLDTYPRLEFSPLPSGENAGSSLIGYNIRNERDTQQWVDLLNEFIKSYEGKGEESISSDVKDCSDENPAIYENGEVCKFDYQYLGSHCTSAESWGYTRRTPCVIIKMNQVMGWVPEVYTRTDIERDQLPEDMPEYLKEIIKQSAIDNYYGEPLKMVWVSCEGENAADQEYIGRIKYTPWYGFPAYYFPYMNIPGYLPPIVALRFVRPKQNVLINIQCRAWAKNINHSEGEGIVRFHLLLD